MEIKDKASIEETHRNIAKEWHPTKNGDLSPRDVTHGSRRIVWWQCWRKHEWQAPVYSRTSGRNCPICNKEQKTSFAEQAIYYYLLQLYPDAINRDTQAIGAELDIYIPSFKCAIEYDGFHWHQNSKTEEKKNELCENKGIKLIRVREEGLSLYDDCYCIVRRDIDDNNSLTSAILEIIKLIDDKANIAVDVKKDETAILECFIRREKENSLLNVAPELAKEWHPTKNGILTPDLFSYGSNRRVWWLGKCGHKWQAKILNRVKGNGCPYCAGYWALAGFNDLATLKPEIAEEWDYIANNDLSPSMVTCKSNKKVYWICSNGHKWSAKVEDRVNGNGCPVCASKEVISGINDLVTTNPILSSEWHPTKNGFLLPSQVTAGSGKKIWWLGKCGHEWQATVHSRTDGRGCPYCSSNILLKGFNDLATVNPSLASEWHPSLNQPLTPDSLMPNSNKCAWWLGKCGHEWKATVASRNNGNGCPFCKGKKIIIGFNDLSTKNPELAKEWHPTKNGSLLPNMFTCSSQKNVWWLGKCGHEWKTTIAHRNDGRGCPYCTNKKILPGHNDLQTKNPAMAAEWHPTKNGDLLPTMVSEYSNKKVWWQCKNGHEWEAKIKSRSARKTGCPVCSRRKNDSNIEL